LNDHKSKLNTLKAAEFIDVFFCLDFTDFKKKKTRRSLTWLQQACSCTGVGIVITFNS